jgi:hypothetical protein
MSVRKSKSPGVSVAGVASTPIAFTPTISWPGNTVAGSSSYYVRSNGLLYVWGAFVESAGTATAALSITLPAGMTCSFPATILGAGWVTPVTSTERNRPLVAYLSSTTVQSPTTYTGSVDTYVFQFTVPVL